MFNKVSLITLLAIIISACGYIICYDDRHVTYGVNEAGTAVMYGEPIITVIKEEDLCPFELESATDVSTSTSTGE